MRFPTLFGRRNPKQTTTRRLKTANNKRHTRKAFFEPLEARQLLAGDISMIASKSIPQTTIN
jgi:hypothetical protein